MSNTKTFTRIFTIADYEEEENWLREQSRKGLHLQKMIQPFLYIFVAKLLKNIENKERKVLNKVSTKKN